MEPPQRIAVVGAGISGLAAAWLLGKRHRVTLYEREARLGGHSNTVDAPGPNGPIGVDTGFIVLNDATYPNLLALFDHLRVPVAPTEMSFAVSLDGGAYEYAGSGLASLFGQPSNLLRPAHYRMITDIVRFFREAPGLIAMPAAASPTLGAFLSQGGYSEPFIARHILPMAAAIWSTPAKQILEFPAASFARFFANHGLLQTRDRPQWRTVVGGSRVYVAAMLDDFDGDVRKACPATRLRRTADGVTITSADGREQAFDACILACHADEALGLLGDADADERVILGAFRYASNRAVLHSDPSLMPKRRRLWSSWNYLGSRNGDGDAMAVSYFMNKLQPLGAAPDTFVTLNPPRPIAPGRTIAAFDYAHPMFDEAAIAAQPRLWDIQGRRHTWFCGSYFGHGFHEDGLQAGLAVAEAIGGVRRPWIVANESGRIQLPAGNDWRPAPSRRAPEAAL